MLRRILKITTLFVFNASLTENSLASVPCQNGISFDNKCDPYENITLIKAKIPFEKENSTHIEVAINKKEDNSIQIPKATKNIIIHKQTQLSYLDSLMRKYSSQFNGNIGLQALIDRSGYLSLKKVEENESKEERLEGKKNINKIVKNKNENRKIVKNNIPVSKKGNIEKKLKYKKYVVKKGDTLIKIAKRMSVKKSLLIKYNHLDKNSTIKIGQVLKIPILINKKISKNIKLANKKKINKDIYIVKRGDTLLKIARKLNISIVTLREINQLGRSDKLVVGQKLYLKARTPKGYKIKRYDIVKKYKVKKSSFIKI